MAALWGRRRREVEETGSGAAHSGCRAAEAGVHYVTKWKGITIMTSRRGAKDFVSAPENICNGGVLVHLFL
ncbi:hypothetical protein E2562_026082 [Oryza meyeriana var. granulata]|uniref:Uncharacterized protein n=1 Tax=Oryza meyeriana var. granulata TaxID=110450 RepID=A0A6G1EYW7_9ORYZ|nr:hypothetical protein E2562_026082 [Oryza meyeriana var. granulata]